MYKDYLTEVVKKQEIPGAVLLISQKNRIKLFESFGFFTDRNDRSTQMEINTIFDIASLTKVMATLPSILLLAASGEVGLDKDVRYYIDDFEPANITIEHLLLHNSGLPADLPYRSRDSQRDIWQELINLTPLHSPAHRTLYSDIGMILLGKIIEKVGGKSLATFSRDHIFTPWNLSDTMYLLPDNKKGSAASTEWYQNNYIQGVVHDEKAFQMNGVSGSAGVFSTAADVAKFASYFLYPEMQTLLPVDLMRYAIKPRQTNRGLGLEVRNGEGEPLSCGKVWPKGSFGHTGFTGTSVWVDPKKELIVVFLTNAVHFGRNTPIKRIRERLHSLIYSSFSGIKI